MDIVHVTTSILQSCHFLETTFGIFFLVVNLWLQNTLCNFRVSYDVIHHGVVKNKNFHGLKCQCETLEDSDDLPALKDRTVHPSNHMYLDRNSRICFTFFVLKSNFCNSADTQWHRLSSYRSLVEFLLVEVLIFVWFDRRACWMLTITLP